MKANELMIGDWVEYRFSGWTEKGGVYKDYQYVQISNIGDLYIKADNGRVASAGGELFYPIPLTPEILEKNGWMKVEEDGVFYPKQLKGELPWIGYATNGYGWIFRIRDFCEIKYVHELQHALRLCGIEKEITI